MENANFINTNDEHTAEVLRSLRFKELPKNGDKYVFINDGRTVFASQNMKMHYTDILTF